MWRLVRSIWVVWVTGRLARILFNTSPHPLPHLSPRLSRTSPGQTPRQQRSPSTYPHPSQTSLPPSPTHTSPLHIPSPPLRMALLVSGAYASDGKKSHAQRSGWGGEWCCGCVGERFGKDADRCGAIDAGGESVQERCGRAWARGKTTHSPLPS